ncbi:MAG TPA: metallophosphoesterase [Clostridia bacterium]|nr:metallophosphoesterase [Clostridia bacterium]
MENWKTEAKRLKFQDNKSWLDIATTLRYNFPSKTEHQIIETIRGYLRRQDEYKKANPIIEKPEVIGIIADTHHPFAHPNYIHFLEDTFEKHRVTRIVHAGDICDNHAISRFQTETDAYSAMTEFEMALKDVQIYTRAFPEVDLLLGNHCLIPARQAATMGIPQQFLKGTKELWNLPKGWNVHEQLIINDVLYEHGTGTSGKNGALDKAINAMQSVVIGHSHSFGGCQYKSNSKSLIFGLNVGCGIQINSYSFRYGKYNKNRETLGCGIVKNSSEGYFIPMSARYFNS